MVKVIKLTESDIHRIIKEAVERIVMNEDYPFSPDEDKQDKIDRYERRMKQLRDDWEDKYRRIRQKFPGKSIQWYEDNLDLL
jgi:hypothetical protein